MLIAIIALIILMGASAVSVYGATEEDVLANINAGVTINGEHRNIASFYIRMAEKYLANNKLTSAQLDKINDAINSCRASWEASGTTTYLEMSEADKKKLIDAAREAAKSSNMKLVIDGNKVQTVDPAGRTYTVNIGDKQIIKQVGANYTSITLFGIFLVLLLAGAVIIARKVDLFKE
jgi:hypothetical protein